MKIMTLNSSGNVGKSMIARELLYPRFEDALIIEVETVNKSSKDFGGGLNVWQFRPGGQYDELYLKIIENENVIVDVGASVLSEFWSEMSAFAGLEMLFDRFVVPTTSDEKQLTDTYKTIRFLRANGIDDEKIKVVFNRVKKSVDAEFSALLKADFDFDESFWIHESPLFSELGLIKKTVADIYNPDLDYYKKKILAAADPKEKVVLLKSDLSNRMAHKVIENFDDLFTRITGEKPVDFMAAASAPRETAGEAPSPGGSGVSDDDEEL